MDWKRGLYFEKDGGANGTGGGGAGGSGADGNGANGGAQNQQTGGGSAGDGNRSEGGDPPLAFDSWVKDQPENVRTMLTGWESGLKTALQNERDARKDLEKKVRDLAGKADKGSDNEKQLTQLADQIAESDRRADFFEAAHAAGVSNLKLAYTVAVQDEMFDRKGNVNFEEMKKGYPELFGNATKPSRGNAGDGTGSLSPTKQSMDDYIRQKVSRS